MSRTLTQRTVQLVAVFALAIAAVACTATQAFAVAVTNVGTTYVEITHDGGKATSFGLFDGNDTSKSMLNEGVVGSNLDSSTIKLSGLNPGSYYYIKFATEKSYNYSWYFRTVSNAPTSLQIESQLIYTKKASFKFKTGSADGYQIKLDPVAKGSNKYLSGTSYKCGTAWVSTLYKSMSLKTAYIATARTYVADDNGVKHWSSWSKKIMILPQPAITKAKCTKSGVKLSWNKVTGAKSYTLYASTSKNSGYKKVCTTKSLSKVITKVKGKKIKKGKNYYAYVIANGKYAGKSYKSAKRIYTTFWKY